jgi:hypothetical protein
MTFRRAPHGGRRSLTSSTEEKSTPTRRAATATAAAPRSERRSVPLLRAGLPTSITEGRTDDSLAGDVRVPALNGDLKIVVRDLDLPTACGAEGETSAPRGREADERGGAPAAPEGLLPVRRQSAPGSPPHGRARQERTHRSRRAPPSGPSGSSDSWLSPQVVGLNSSPQCGSQLEDCHDENMLKTCRSTRPCLIPGGQTSLPPHPGRERFRRRRQRARTPTAPLSLESVASRRSNNTTSSGEVTTNVVAVGHPAVTRRPDNHIQPFRETLGAETDAAYHLPQWIPPADTAKDFRP